MTDNPTTQQSRIDMNKFLSGMLAGFFALCVAVLVLAASASTIARECRTVGAFYVGETVYDCKERR